MTIRQADVARELQVSEMTTSRAAKALGCDTRPLSDYDSLRLFFAAETQSLGLAPHIIFHIMAEFSHDVRMVLQQQNRRSWLVFVETEKASFRTATTSESHLSAMVDLFPLSLILPLHSIAERARQRLAVLKSRKAAA